MTQLSDTDLVKHAQQGNVHAVGDLFDRYQPRIYKYVRMRVYDHHKAQDLTGEIFLLMIKNLPGYRDIGIPFSAWLYRIAHNLVINHYQKEQVTRQVSLVHAENSHPHTATLAVMVEQQLEIEGLLQALEKLEDIQREVIILRFLADLSLKEVAQTLDKTVATIKAIQHRGLLALKMAFEYESV